MSKKIILAVVAPLAIETFLIGWAIGSLGDPRQRVTGKCARCGVAKAFAWFRRIKFSVDRSAMGAAGHSRKLTPSVARCARGSQPLKNTGYIEIVKPDCHHAPGRGGNEQLHCV